MNEQRDEVPRKHTDYEGKALALNSALRVWCYVLKLLISVKLSFGIWLEFE